VSDPSYNGYASNTDVSYYCDTDGGSSGSPVISRRTNEVIALHHFGGCPNSGVRVDLIYRQVQGLL
jgi:V8-like Glu-specific endopeptidase